MITLTVDGFEICIQGDPHADRPLRRIAWAGYAMKRGSSMQVTEEEKREALAIIRHGSAAIALVEQLAGTGYDPGPQAIADLIDTARLITRQFRKDTQ
jgi:hypothetical protein